MTKFINLLKLLNSKMFQKGPKSEIFQTDQIAKLHKTSNCFNVIDLN